MCGWIWIYMYIAVFIFVCWNCVNGRNFVPVVSFHYFRNFKDFSKIIFYDHLLQTQTMNVKKKSLTLQVLVLAALKRIPKMINHFLKKMKTYFPLWDSFTLFFKVSRKKTPKYLTQNTGNILENDYTLLLSHGIL